MNKYSVYLVKSTVSDPSDALTEKALSLFPTRATELEIEDDHEYDDCEAYAFFSEPSAPKWANAYNGIAELPEEIDVNRSGSLFFAEENGRWFVFTFGDGFQHLDKRKVHMDFGLRTAINMLDAESVKSREAIDITKSQRGASQAALPTAFRDLGDYDTVTIVKSVSGKVDDAGTVSGASSLKFASKKPLNHLSEDLRGALIAYKSEQYKDTDFAVIDKLEPVRDRSYTDILDAALADSVSNKSDEVELVVPIMLSHENDVAYVRFMSIEVKPPPEFIEASIENYLTALPEGTLIDVAALKKHRLMAHDQDGSYIYASSIYKCIVGTIESDVSGEARKYVINEGDWYAVSDDFKNEVDGYFDHIRNKSLDQEFSPLKLISIMKKGEEKIGFESEEEYNSRIASDYELVLLDKELISMPGVPGPGLELCDLLDVENKRFIHVKKGSTQSSILSHFFNQGINPIEFYRGSPEFASRALAKVRSVSEEAGDALAASNLSEFTVHYLLLDYPRADGTYNIPFFSRITLYDKARAFRSLVKEAAVSFVKPEDEVT